MYGIDSKHFCVGVTHLTGIQLSPSSASRGKKCGLFELAKGASWLQIKINQLTPSPSSLPHLPSPLTSLSSHILPLSSHVPPLSRPSPLKLLPSHIPPLSHPSHLTPSHLTSLPSHTPSLPKLSREIPIFTNWTSMLKKMLSSSTHERTTQQKSM